MSEDDGNAAMTKCAERPIKVGIPVRADEDLVKIPGQTTGSSGGKTSMADAEDLLEEGARGESS